jgi:hypothetical protein
MRHMQIKRTLRPNLLSYPFTLRLFLPMVPVLFLAIAIYFSASPRKAYADVDIDTEVVKNFELFDKMNIVENLELAANYDFLADEDND